MHARVSSVYSVYKETTSVEGEFSDTSQDTHSWAGMNVIHPVVTICHIADAVVTDGRWPEGVTPFTVDLRADSTAKREGSQGVVVCKENYCVDQLRQGPAVLFSLQKLL